VVSLVRKEHEIASSVPLSLLEGVEGENDLKVIKRIMEEGRLSATLHSSWGVVTLNCYAPFVSTRKDKEYREYRSDFNDLVENLCRKWIKEGKRVIVAGDMDTPVNAYDVSGISLSNWNLYRRDSTSQPSRRLASRGWLRSLLGYPLIDGNPADDVPENPLLVDSYDYYCRRGDSEPKPDKPEKKSQQCASTHVPQIPLSSVLRESTTSSSQQVTISV
jgi:exonuclease III